MSINADVVWQWATPEGLAVGLRPVDHPEIVEGMILAVVRPPPVGIVIVRKFHFADEWNRAAADVQAGVTMADVAGRDYAAG